MSHPLYTNSLLMNIWSTFWPLKCLFPSNWSDQLTWASCRDDSWPSLYPPLTRVRQKWSGEIFPPIRCLNPCLAPHLLSLCLCSYTAYVTLLFLVFSFLPTSFVLCSVVKMFMLGLEERGCEGGGWRANYKCSMPGARTSSLSRECERDRISTFIDEFPQFLSPT